MMKNIKTYSAALLMALGFRFVVAIFLDTVPDNRAEIGYGVEVTSLLVRLILTIIR